MYILDLVNYTQLRFENVVLWNKMKNKQTIPHSSKNKHICVSVMYMCVSYV
jgi:hypothetical protein